MSQELAAVRRELGALVDRRQGARWTFSDASRYEDLCRRERDLLGYTVTLAQLVTRS